MAMRFLTVFAFAFVLGADPVYSVSSLGNLGGPYTTASAINNSGAIVGYGENLFGDFQAFTNSGTIQGMSLAFGINDSGAVAGAGFDSNGVEHGLISSAGGLVDIGPNTAAMAINDSGQVAGSANGQAFLMTNGVVQNLPLGAAWSTAYGLNARGEVTGYAETAPGTFRGFTWAQNSGLNTIGTFGGRNSYAMDVNDSGQVVGSAALANGYQHAFLYSGGQLRDLSTLRGGSSYAYGINNATEIVGMSDGRAFLWMNGIMLDLNSLIPAGSGWQLTEAAAINNLGQIVGTGLFDGQSTAFRLDPIVAASTTLSSQSLISATVPEPATVGLMSVAGVFLLMRLRRRK